MDATYRIISIGAFAAHPLWNEQGAQRTAHATTTLIEAGKAMPKDGIFRLQSMTKPIVAVAALVLYDEGKFTLDEPISKHLPEWAETKVLEKSELVPARHAITPRMLMSRSSGLYYGPIEGGAFSGGGVSRDEDTTLETFSKELARKPLKFHPGEGYQYGHSIDVLGRYTAFVNPEMLLFSGATSLYALPADAAAATAGQPINDLFWVAGAWGPGYPMTGFSNGGTVDHQIEPVRATSLSAFRGLSLMHRLGFLSETIGTDNLCERNQRFVIRKDAYRWQFLAPSPESDGPAEGAPPPVNSTNQVREVNPPSRYSTCTHPTGASTVGWGMWRDVPATGEDHSYLLFQWTDCCFGVYGD